MVKYITFLMKILYLHGTGTGLFFFYLDIFRLNRFLLNHSYYYNVAY
jgi:hypothetical protein